MADEAPRVVADTNIFVTAVLPQSVDSSYKNGFQRPPCREFLDRAFYGQFTLLISVATWLELLEKLQEFKVSEDLILELGTKLRDIAEEVQPESSATFSSDPDDDKFFHVALSGEATHLVSADRDVISRKKNLELPFRVCQVLSFLREFRESIKAKKKVKH